MTAFAGAADRVSKVIAAMAAASALWRISGPLLVGSAIQTSGCHRRKGVAPASERLTLPPRLARYTPRSSLRHVARRRLARRRVAQQHGARAARDRRGEEAEVRGRRAVGEDLLALAEHDRVDEQLQLVVRLGGEQRLHEVEAADDVDVLVAFAQRGDLGRGIRPSCVVPSQSSASVPREATYFGTRLSCRPIAPSLPVVVVRPVRREDVVGLAAEDERVELLDPRRSLRARRRRRTAAPASRRTGSRPRGLRRVRPGPGRRRRAS